MRFRFLFSLLTLTLMLSPMLVSADSICCTCTVGTSNICLTLNEPGVTRCDQVAQSQTIKTISTTVPLAGDIHCEANPLSPSACQPLSIGTGVCRVPPMDAGGLSTFLQSGSSADESGTEVPPDFPNMDDTIQPGKVRPGTVVPNLSVPIPGLTFSQVTADDQYVYTPFLAQYISAIYRYAVGISALVATIMVVYGGFLYLIGSTTGDISRGKSIIQDALVGMILVVAAYALIYAVNPDSVNLEVLRLQNVERSPFVVPVSAVPAQNPPSPFQTTKQPTTSQAPANAPTKPPIQQQGGITTVYFNYQPNSNPHWPSNQAQIIFPTRLANQSRPIHLYIYIHGFNKGEARSSEARYTPLLKGALRKVAGNMDIVIAGPHYLGASNPVFMTGFTLDGFMTSLRAALQAEPSTKGLTIQDIVVTGHSAATCGRSRLLGNAFSKPLQGQIGIVAYDGCVEGPFSNAETYSPSDGTFLMDMDDMGFDPDFGAGGKPPYDVARKTFNLDQKDCPSYVPADALHTTQNPNGRVVACYANSGGNIWMFMNHYGHGPSVGHMTDWAFQHFYNK